MGMMMIRHKVRDYGQWRPIFDGHVEMQRAADLINPRVYHSADSNKSEIVGGHEATRVPAGCENCPKRDAHHNPAG
jgi:hypothetical protein